VPQPRRQPRQARARDKVDRIVAAARAQLLAEGPDGFNTNRIAERAGVGIGSLYEYFPNKQAIVERLIEDLSASETDAILARFAELENTDAVVAIRAVIATVFELYRDNHGLYRMLWAMATHPREIGHRPGEREVKEHMRRRLAPLAGRLHIDDLDLTIFTVFHLVESLCEQFAAQGVERFGAERCTAEITAAALRYLGLPA